MAVVSTILGELHRILRQLTDLRERQVRGPKQIVGAESVVKKAEADLATTKETQKKARLASDEKQLQLKQREARVADLQGKLNACSTNREYQLLKDQIAADLQANSVLSDEILEGLEILDQLQASVKDAEVVLAKSKQELEKTRAKVADQLALLESEIVRVQGQLVSAEKGLPDDFQADYQRLARGRGDQGLAPLDGDSCGGCFQTVTTQMLSQLLLGHPVFCKSCGCMLYQAEGSPDPT